VIHIRNCATPIYGSDSCLYRFIPWIWREALLCARWTERANNADAAWAGNVIATLTDMYVNPVSPGIVRTAGGNVSAHAGRTLTLIDPTNYANCVIANIKAVVDSTTLLLDDWNLPKPWVTASGLTGRIHLTGQTTLLTAGAWTVMEAPVGSPPFQVRITCSSTANRVTFDCLPKGDYTGAKTYTAAFNHDHTSTLRALRLNADIDGENFMLWHTPFGSTGVNSAVWYGMAGGSLTGAAATDLYPRFITECLIGHAYAWLTCYTRAFCSQLNMLGFTDTQITAYVESRKTWSDSVGNDASGIFTGTLQIWNNFKIGAAYPTVVMGDVVAGGYRRGKLPWRLVNVTWEDWRKLDVAATMRASQGSIVLPHAGLLGCDKFAPITTL